MKAPLLLLHGAIGASSQLKAIAENLSARYEVHLFDFPGHGGTVLPDAPFSIKLFADAVQHYIEKHQLQQLTVFGYSMGGYVAMYLARHQPAIAARIITLGTKFHWDEATAAREVKMLDPAEISAKVPAFAANLEVIHAPNDWKIIVQRTAGMLLEMGRDNPLKPDDYPAIRVPCLVMLGDRDRMVTLEETVNTYKALPDARMAVLPGTPHPVEQVNPSLLACLLQI